MIGATAQGETGMRFYPSKADALKQKAQAGIFPTPHNIEVHIVEEDWQAGPQALVEVGKAVGIKVHVVLGRGHMLGSDYVGQLLDAWLTAE